jgi:hypothetical protein
MDERQPVTISTRSSGGMSLPKPRWGFWKGMLAGVAIEVPALTAAVWGLAQLGIGNAEVPVMRIMRLTTVFAGVAAIFTAGGIGRLAAYASIDGGRRRAVFVAAGARRGKRRARRDRSAASRSATRPLSGLAGAPGRRRGGRGGVRCADRRGVQRAGAGRSLRRVVARATAERGAPPVARSARAGPVRCRSSPAHDAPVRRHV